MRKKLPKPMRKTQGIFLSKDHLLPIRQIIRAKLRIKTKHIICRRKNATGNCFQTVAIPDGTGRIPGCTETTIVNYEPIEVKGQPGVFRTVTETIYQGPINKIPKAAIGRSRDGQSYIYGSAWAY
ncbi:MAG: hypothetical protein P1U85_19160 [Verrucomicrobiales bacterium]|nr:hypothetical protein [Verrucomicrobiales bacterium]